jgi:hypothetical protein
MKIYLHSYLFFDFLIFFLYINFSLFIHKKKKGQIKKSRLSNKHLLKNIESSFNLKIKIKGEIFNLKYILFFFFK